jgi:hypothetical protein
MAYSGITSASMNNIWKAKILLRVRISLWQMYYDRLQSGVCLNSKGSDKCGIYGARETADHIFFHTVLLSQFAWCLFRDSFEWNRFPNSNSRLLGSLARE